MSLHPSVGFMNLLNHSQDHGFVTCISSHSNHTQDHGRVLFTHQQQTNSTAPWSATGEVQASDPFQGWSSWTKQHSVPKREDATLACTPERWCRTSTCCRWYQRSFLQDTGVRWSAVYMQSSLLPSNATDTRERSFWNCVFRESTTSCSSNCTFQFHLACFLRFSALMRPRRCDFDFESHLDLTEPFLCVVSVRHYCYPAMLMLCSFTQVVGDERFCLHYVSWCRCRLDCSRCPPYQTEAPLFDCFLTPECSDIEVFHTARPAPRRHPASCG